MNQTRYLIGETLISAAINGILSAAFATLVFSGEEGIEASAVIADAIPQSLFVTFFAVFVPTLLTRRRMADGKLQPLPYRANRWPAQAVLRALLAAGLVTVLAGILHVAVLSSLGLSQIAFAPLLAYKIIYAVLLSAVVTPWALRMSLSEFAGRVSS